jgi:hypothetical protein
VKYRTVNVVEVNYVVFIHMWLVFNSITLQTGCNVVKWVKILLNTTHSVC